MLNYTTIYNFLAELSEQQQEMIVGLADFELSGSNFANRLVALRGLTFSGPNGSFASSAGQSMEVNTAAQDFLGLGAPSVPNFPALGEAPVLTGLGASPTIGMRNLGNLENLESLRNLV